VLRRRRDAALLSFFENIFVHYNTYRYRYTIIKTYFRVIVFRRACIIEWFTETARRYSSLGAWNDVVLYTPVKYRGIGGGSAAGGARRHHRYKTAAAVAQGSAVAAGAQGCLKCARPRVAVSGAVFAILRSRRTRFPLVFVGRGPRRIQPKYFRATSAFGAAAASRVCLAHR